jgi:hypothetical protein
MDYFNTFQQQHIAKYGIVMDRPWTADADAWAAKQAIDQQYLSGLAAFNTSQGTSYQPTAQYLGAVQLTAYVPKPRRHRGSDILNVVTGGAYGAVTGNYGDSSFGHYLSDIWGSTHTAALYDLYDAWKTSGDQGDIYGFIDRAMDPGGTVDPSLRALGEQLPEWLRNVAPMIGGLIGQLWGPWGAAAGAGAGAKIAGYDTQQAMRTASMAALMKWASGTDSPGLSGLSSEMATEAAKSFVKKWLINQVLGLAFPAENGGLNINYEGMSGGPDLSGLSGIAPKSDSLSFPLISAASGLDYVPRDNFRINAHRGEAVLTERDASAWRGGAGNGELAAEVKALREEMRAALYAIAKNTAKSAKVSDRWDVDGLPAERTLV